MLLQEIALGCWCSCLLQCASEVGCGVQGVNSPSFRLADHTVNATPTRISSHPLPSPEPSSHAVEQDDDSDALSSHALQFSPSNSPQSSVGSVGYPGHGTPVSPMTAPAAKNNLPTPRPFSISPFQHFSGADGLDTPQSTMTKGSDLTSHVIQHSPSDSGSGNDAVDSAATSPQGN